MPDEMVLDLNEIMARIARAYADGIPPEDVVQLLDETRDDAWLLLNYAQSLEARVANLERRHRDDQEALGNAEGVETEIQRLLVLYADVEGAHHKQWLSDQILRLLWSAESYGEFRQRHPEWTEGIAP